MFKYVRCIDAEGCPFLTEGKEYSVKEASGFCDIAAEDGVLRHYAKERFEEVVVAAQGSTGCRHRINYRLGSPEIREAWFAYKRAERGIPLSVSSFVAGWNAAKEVKHEG